eukprot:scaffold5878_cov179-Ochromonas_danica.AAC.1
MMGLSLDTMTSLGGNTFLIHANSTRRLELHQYLEYSVQSNPAGQGEREANSSERGRGSCVIGLTFLLWKAILPCPKACPFPALGIEGGGRLC